MFSDPVFIIEFSMRPPPSPNEIGCLGAFLKSFAWLACFSLIIASFGYWKSDQYNWGILIFFGAWVIGGLAYHLFEEHVVKPLIQRRYQRRYQMWQASSDGQDFLAQEARCREQTEAAQREAAAAKRKEEESRRAEFAKKACAKEFWFNLSPIGFESKVGELFRAAGYNVRMTPASNDEGIDLWLEKGASRSILQCKRFRTGNVSRPDIQQFYGVLMADESVKEGFFVTTAGFTEGAVEFTKKMQKPIHLIDVDRLIKMAEGALSEAFIRSGPTGQLDDSSGGQKRRRWRNWGRWRRP